MRFAFILKPKYELRVLKHLHWNNSVSYIPYKRKLNKNLEPSHVFVSALEVFLYMEVLHISFLRTEFLTAVTVKNTVFWGVMPCCLLDSVNFWHSTDFTSQMIIFSIKFLMWQFQKRDGKLPSWIRETTGTCSKLSIWARRLLLVPRRSKDNAPSPLLLLAGMIKWATSGKGRKGYKSYSLVTAVWDRDGKINCGARNRKIKMKPLLLL